MKPLFVVTIDTEGDNLWARGSTVTTRNAVFLPRFQSLCERHGIRPTWLTNWEMANDPAFVEFGRDVLARNAGEIGMHLHAWNSPPIMPLTVDDDRHHPYLIEYPEPLLREKVAVMTDTLERTFGTKMVSHRAGRFSFDERYARALVDRGYLVDGSVTPNVSWRGYKGHPDGTGGSDFSRFPERAYFLDAGDISRAGDSPLLELPVTVTRPWVSAASWWLRQQVRGLPIAGPKLANRLMPRAAWLYPKGHNHRWLRGLLRRVLLERRGHAEFMIHSSELMPGGSPNFPTERSIERLYGALESLFEMAARRFHAVTMAECYPILRRELRPAMGEVGALAC